jgi:hypothetical protein
VGICLHRKPHNKQRKEKTNTANCRDQQAVSETNTIDEKESPKTNKDVSETNTLWKAPKKQKMMTTRKGLQKKMKKNAFFCRSVWPEFAKFLLFGKYLTFPCLLVYVAKIHYLCTGFETKSKVKSRKQTPYK